ncbi:MAG: zf-HC2 domain-containing protein [Nitrincola lacisaponensis]|uniref:zf-HC2 domain-containing protein n=1 Tax=Nitrincola lacisaponensis TaxID=267850 RepID=UPI003918A838
MLTCHQATQLMSSRLDRETSLTEKMNLKVHLMMCSSCRRCDTQLSLIHQAGKRWHLNTDASSTDLKK